MVRWSPWDALRLAGQRVEFRRARLPDRFGGGVCVPESDTHWAVVLDDRLTAAERRVTLAHELEHAHRQGGAGYPGQPPGWAAVVVRDEAAVDRAVVEKMVPLDELAAFVERRLSTGDPIMAAELAEYFNVTVELVEAAAELYRRAAP